MKYLFLEYPKCSTSNRAKKWLDNNKIQYDSRHIVNDNPSFEELKLWIEKSNLSIKKFFNTSGLVYRNLNLKDKLITMSYDEQIKLLSQNGMLIKRPILIGDDFVLVGFNESDWTEQLKSKE